MARNLVVITGAGASYDCASDVVHPNPRMRPPLVKELFTPAFADILVQYRLAQAAAADIRTEIGREIEEGSEPAMTLERFLREQMRDAKSEYIQRRYKQVPLYLQHVLDAVGQTDGRGYTRDVDNYNALVNGALEFDSALFLTLNYDTLLDDCLFAYTPLEDLSSYVTADPRWALVKLHGSVNWGSPVPVEEPLPDDFTLTIAAVNDLFDGASLENRLDVIELRDHPELPYRRFDGKSLYYPALSVPLGSEDELVCDDLHIATARNRLRSEDGIHLLVIGYSGLDQEVIKLLSESGGSLRSLLVANGNLEASRKGADAILSAFPGFELQDENLLAAGFTKLVNSGRLNDFFELTQAR